MVQKGLRNETFDRRICLAQIGDCAANGVAHAGEARCQMPDLVAAPCIGDRLFEVAIGNGAGLAAQLEERIEHMLLQQTRSDEIDERQQEQKHGGGS